MGLFQLLLKWETGDNLKHKEGKDIGPYQGVWGGTQGHTPSLLLHPHLFSSIPTPPLPAPHPRSPPPIVGRILCWCSPLCSVQSATGHYHANNSPPTGPLSGIHCPAGLFSNTGTWLGKKLLAVMIQEIRDRMKISAFLCTHPFSRQITPIPTLLIWLRQASLLFEFSVFNLCVWRSWLPGVSRCPR